jgi:DNA-binding CsgD family transcriptional regulator/tetratricopeptide (TPR) repeat protein
VVGAIRADQSVVVELAPLSESAVAALAGHDAAGVYAATGGNPFYVTELLASRGAPELPASVANAVLGRASRLDDASRRLVELVSAVPSRIRTALLDAVMPGWTDAAVEPERRQLLHVDSAYVRFRHELARHAIRSSIPVAARRRLHAEILEALLAIDADPADIVHHAEAAGADGVVATHALVAARRAAAVGSTGEAHSHYVRAADFADRLPFRERAIMLEELGLAAYLAGRVSDSFPAIERAIGIYDDLGDAAAVGRCKRILSRSHWFAGHGEVARRTALEAVTILEPLGESVELARAYSGLSQMAMLAEDVDGTLLWGNQALNLATRFGDVGVRAHALVNIGTVRMQMGYGAAPAQLLEAHAIADAAGDRHEAVRALTNLAYTLMCWVVPGEALRYARRALSYAEQYEVDAFASYLRTTIAWLRLRSGAWDEAERAARREIERGSSVAQLLAKTVLAELAVRRGDPDAPDRLRDVTAQAELAGELQRIGPVLELAFEWSLTTGTPVPASFGRLIDGVRSSAQLTGWGAIRVTAWTAVTGDPMEVDQPLSAPHAAMLRRDWQAAADAFGDVGWAYDRALMLSLLDDEDSLTEAIEVARGLGAEPLTRRVAARMRDLGLRVPHGPRVATRANPAGLTTRQLEVVALLVEGLTNTEIADRLVVSPRTVEHHVAAVLAKLGAPTRREVARRAAELQVVAGT